MSPPQVIEIPPPTGGLDTVTAPEALGKLKARQIENLLVDRPGKLIPRGPLVGAALGSGVDAAAALETRSSVLVSQLDTSVPTRLLFPWETHLGLPNRTATAETALVRASTTLRAVDLSTFAASDQALADRGLVPGPRQTQLGGFTYAISLDSAGELSGGDSVTLADGSSKIRRTELLSLDPTGTTLPTFSNPNFDTNVTGWNFSTNASFQWQGVTPGGGMSAPCGVLSGNGSFTGAVSAITVLSGTFKAGRTYVISFVYYAPPAAGCGTFSVWIDGQSHKNLSPSDTVQSANYLFTPTADQTNPTFTLNAPVTNLNPPYYVDSFTITQTTYAKLGSNAPTAAQDVTAYLSRLFMLGGIAPGDTSATPAVKHSTLWWTDPGGPSDLNSWKDDVSGLVNQVQIGDDDTDPGVALGRLQNQLLVFKRRSLWALLGSSPANFTVRRAALIGCLDPRTVVEYGDAVYWLSEQGFMRYDGAQITNLSRDVQPDVLAAANQAVGDAGVPGGTALAAALANDYIMLAIGRRDTAAQLFWGLLHVPTGAWTTLSTDARVGVLRTVTDSGYVADGGTVWAARTIGDPDANPLAAQEVTNPPDPAYDAYVQVSGGTAAYVFQHRIRATLKHRMIALASPLYSAQLLRFLLDYVWLDPDQTDDDANTGWHVSLKNSLGAELAALDLGTQGTASTKLRRRAAIANFAEVSSDLSLEITILGTAPRWTKAELYTAVLEYQQSKLRATE